MSIAMVSRIKNEMCYSQICVDAYDEGEMRGRLYNPYYSEPVFFYSAVELLKSMEKMFDRFEYPNATVKLRKFVVHGETSSCNEYTFVKPAMSAVVKKHNVKGKLATFKVRVMFRRNASWQGTLRVMEIEKQSEFHSVLEFLELLDDTFSRLDLATEA